MWMIIFHISLAICEWWTCSTWVSESLNPIAVLALLLTRRNLRYCRYPVVHRRWIHRAPWDRGRAWCETSRNIFYHRTALRSLTRPWKAPYYISEVNLGSPYLKNIVSSPLQTRLRRLYIRSKYRIWVQLSHELGSCSLSLEAGYTPCGTKLIKNQVLATFNGMLVEVPLSTKSPIDYYLLG